MSLTLAQLTIEMAANVARLRTDMDAAWRTVDRSTSMMAASMKRVENIISLGLGGAAVGAAASFGRSLYEASAQAERLASTLNFASGGNGVRELAYVSDVANRLGLDFNSTAQAYANFAAASRGTNIEGTQTQAVFEAVAKASAVMGLSTDNTRGVLLALQQMMSKGTVSAEELRGQLGERLPGAFEKAAKAMGVTTQELGKMLEQGEVISSEFLPLFAKQLESDLGGAAEAAATRLDAAMNRMTNAWERFKKSLGDSGISQGGASTAGLLANDLNAVSDAMETAKATGSGFFGQMNAGFGMLIGRSLALQHLPFDWSNQFLPLAGRIQAADQRLAELQARAKQGWGVNIYFKADLASARAEVEALQALQVAMGMRKAYETQSTVRAFDNQYTTPDPYAGAKALDDVRKGAKLRQDIQREEGAKAVEIAKAFGKAIADAGENPAYAAQLAAERDARLIALRRDTHAQLEAFDKSHSQRTRATQRKEVDAFAQLQKKLLEDMAKDSASAQAELMGLGRAQEQFLALAGSPEWAALTNAQRAVVAGLYEERIAREQANNGVRASIALRQELARLALDEVDSVSARVTALRDENDTMGLSAQQLGALQVARTEEAIASAEATLAIKIAAGARGEEVEAVTLLVEQLRELKKAQLENTAKKMATETAKEGGKAAESIEKDITSALFRAFESGKDFASTFTDTLRNSLKTALLKPVIEQMVRDVMGSLQGVMGGLGGAGGGSGASSLLNSLGMMFGGTGSSGGAVGGSGASGIGATGLAASSGFLGSMAAVAGPAMVAYALSKAISGGYQMNGVLGKLGNFGGIIGGLANRAFGRKAPEITEQGITGTIGGGSFSGQAFADIVEKGGWFRSDKRYTNTSALDAGTASALNTAAGSTLAQAQVWAEALKLPATSLASITTQMRVKLGQDQAENARAIDEAVADYQDKLAATFGPALLPFQKAGERLAQTLQRLAVVQTFSEQINTLGGVFSRVANLSLQARESFIDLAGGLDALNQMVTGYTQNYYSREEIAGLKAGEIQAALQAAGLDGSALSSRGDYRALVESLNVSTVEGREQLALLLRLQGDFAQVGDYLSETGQSLASAAAQAPATSVLQNLLSGTQAEQQSQAQVDATLTVAAKVDGLGGLMQQVVNQLAQMRASGTSMQAGAAPAWEVNA